jgi:thioredoxin reductase
MIEDSSPEVAVIGGGAAGSSAALVLGRARAGVLLVDAGRPSNTPSTGIGGLLGHDGAIPVDFYRRAAGELAAYPTVARTAATVTAIHGDEGPRWRLELDGGATVRTDRLVLAMGMRYDVPAIDGIEPRWGASVFHCPFCHGWEHRDQPMAVLGGAPGTVDRTLLLRRWTERLTLVTAGTVLTGAERDRLAGAGVHIVDAGVASVDGPGRELRSVTLTDGTVLDVRGLLVPAPHQHRAPALLDGLGLATTETGHLVIDALGATSVAGIWAAGDLTGPLANVARAIAEGSMCGIAVTRDLVAAPG